MNLTLTFKLTLFCICILCSRVSIALERNFEQDLNFISQFEQPIVLTTDNNQAQIIISAKHQGRVFSSTATGISGHSYGWINYNALQNNGTAVGGEDRFWLAPIGSQFSLYYPETKKMVAENWRVPITLTNSPVTLVNQTNASVTFQITYELKNHIGSSFIATLDRTINLFSPNIIERNLAISLPDSVSSVGFESVNVLINAGDDWQKDKGLITPWILGMFKGNDHSTAVFPLKNSNNGKPIINSYLYPLNEQRLKLKRDHVLFKVDGRYRSKIGIKSDKATPIMGYYDNKEAALTIVKFSFENAKFYPDATEAFLTVPYNGDVINSYNHGAMDGSLLSTSSFFELESAAKLSPLKQGQSISHTHQTYHFEGPTDALNQLSETLLGISIKDIEATF